MIYLDASALVTFVVRREHVEALERFLGTRESKTCTSTIGMVETVRTCDQLGSYPSLMVELTQEHDEMPVTSQIRDAAANVPGVVRSLDAVHIATAELIGPELIALVTYDRRLAVVARDRGLPVAMPGME